MLLWKFNLPKKNKKKKLLIKKNQIKAKITQKIYLKYKKMQRKNKELQRTQK